MFGSLGLERYHRIEKVRTTYTLGTTTFDIDTISKPFKIPTYYEIEVKDYKDIDKILKLLKIPKNKALPWGTKKLLKYYESKKTKIWTLFAFTYSFLIFLQPKY